MDESISNLRIEIDGRWSAEEFSQALAAISDLYDLRLFLELMRDEIREWEYFYEALNFGDRLRGKFKRRRVLWAGTPFGFTTTPLPALDEESLTKLSRLLLPEERLQVRVIQYASPGHADLAGFGVVIGHIKDFAIRLIERRDSKRQRDLSDERASLENDRLRIENAQAFLELARGLGYSDMEMRNLLHYVLERQGTLISLIAGQKITSISISEDRQ